MKWGCFIKHPLPFYNLGIMYLNGSGVKQSYRKAAMFFEKAYKMGDQDSYPLYMECIKRQNGQ